MPEKDFKAVKIPARAVMQSDGCVIILNNNKKTIIQNARLIGEISSDKSLKSVTVTYTDNGVEVRPCYDEFTHKECGLKDGFFDGKTLKPLTNFSVEEFVEIYLNNVTVRTVIADGKFTFSKDNLIPTYWQFLKSEDLEKAVTKIKSRPVLSKRRSYGEDIYEIDDFANSVKVFSSENLDEILSSYLAENLLGETIGTFISEIMKKQNISNAKLSRMTGISETAISLYKNDNRPCNLEHLTAIAVALRLTIPQSRHLLQIAGVSLEYPTRKNILYRLFLDSCFFSPEITVSKCNELLIAHDLEPLTRLKISKQ